MGKVIFFLSTGRTGTAKLAHYLDEYCADSVKVDHQTSSSRTVNFLSNMHYYGFPVKRLINKKVHKILLQNSDKDYYINCDPLLSFGLSCVDFTGFDVCFIHIERNSVGFSRSMVNWQFTRLKSFLAHSFAPFWQPDLWPFEHIVHLFNKKYLRNKYNRIWRIKNEFFESEFKHKFPYLKITFEELFNPQKGDVIFGQLRAFMGIKIDFYPHVFFKKENISTAGFFR